MKLSRISEDRKEIWTIGDELIIDLESGITKGKMIYLPIKSNVRKSEIEE